MPQISDLLKTPVKVRGPTSERSYWIQKLADSIGVPFQNIMKEVWHLKGEEGTQVLRMIWEDVMREGDNRDYRAKKLRELINKSK